MEKVLFKLGDFITPRHLQMIQNLAKKNLDNRLASLISQTGLVINENAGGSQWLTLDAGSGRIIVRSGRAVFADYEFGELTDDTDPISITADGNTYYVIATRDDTEDESGTVAVTAGSLTIVGTDTFFADELEDGDRILMDSAGSHAGNEVELIVASVTDDTHIIVESLDADGNAVSFTSESGNTFSVISRFATGYPADGNKNIRNHDEISIVVTTTPASYSDGIQIATVVNNAGTLTITDLRDDNKLILIISETLTNNQYVWSKVALTITTSTVEENLVTGSGLLALGNLSSGQSALPYFINPCVRIGDAYQDRFAFKSTQESVSGGICSFGMKLSSAGKAASTYYFDIIITEMTT